MSTLQFRTSMVKSALALSCLAITEFSFQQVAILGVSFFNLLPFTVISTLTVFATWLAITAAEIDWKILMLMLPVCLFLLLFAILGTFLCYPFEKIVQTCLTTNKSSVVRLICSYDSKTEDVTGYSWFVVNEKTLIPGLLTERQNLLTVKAVSTAQITCIDGKTVKFCASKTCGKPEEIIHFLPVMQSKLLIKHAD